MREAHHPEDEVFHWHCNMCEDLMKLDPEDGFECGFCEFLSYQKKHDTLHTAM